jgi:hypothetical protein
VDLTLGAVAHRGGLLVRRSELTVGVVQAVSRSSGLSIELIARRPLDRRDATQRQREIRSPSVAAAPRVLLPEFDEGENLRLGWLDEAGRAHWAFPSSSSSWSGDSYDGVDGPGCRMVCELPALFGEVSIVLAWPEIGFVESVVTLPLPDRGTVKAASTSIWSAPLDTLPVPELTYHDAPDHDAVHVETGTIVAAPRVLHRNDHTAVTLTRLAAIGSVLSMEILGVTAVDTPSLPRVATIKQHNAFWLSPQESMSSGGHHGSTSTQDYIFDTPTGGVLDLIVTWPDAKLPDTRVRIPLQLT